MNPRFLPTFGRGALTAAACATIATSPIFGQRVTEQEIVDSILKRRNDMPGADRNNDKTVDVRDLVVFLNNQPVEVFFEKSSSVALDWVPEHKIAVRLAKKASGKIRLVFTGGDVDASKVGAAVAGSEEREITLADSDRFEISVPIAKTDRLPLARSIVISLGIPRGGESLILPDQNAPAPTRRAAAHEIRVVSHTAGLYAGTITFPAPLSANPQTGLPVFGPIAPVAPISVRLARRDGESLLLLEPNPFLPELVRLAQSGSSWPSGATASGTTKVVGVLPERTVGWTITLGQFQEGASNSVPQVPVNIRITGLARTASRALELPGVLYLSQTEPALAPTNLAQK